MGTCAVLPIGPDPVRLDAAGTKSAEAVQRGVPARTIDLVHRLHRVSAASRALRQQPRRRPGALRCRPGAEPVYDYQSSMHTPSAAFSSSSANYSFPVSATPRRRGRIRRSSPSTAVAARPRRRSGCLVSAGRRGEFRPRCIGRVPLATAPPRQPADPAGQQRVQGRTSRLGLVEGVNLVTDLALARGDPYPARRPCGKTRGRATRRAFHSERLRRRAGPQRTRPRPSRSCSRPSASRSRPVCGRAWPDREESDGWHVSRRAGAQAGGDPHRGPRRFSVHRDTVRPPCRRGACRRFPQGLAASPLRLRLGFQEVRKYEDLAPASSRWLAERVRPAFRGEVALTGPMNPRSRPLYSTWLPADRGADEPHGRRHVAELFDRLAGGQGKSSNTSTRS